MFPKFNIKNIIEFKMIIVGDIGNTETKICLVNSKNKIIKRS